MEEELKRVIKVATGLQAGIAGDVWPNGGTLVCSNCGSELEFDRGEAAYFLAHGWPKCCGRTMGQKRQEQPDRPKS